MRWVPVLLVVCAAPVSAQMRMIVGNTLIDVPPGVMMADASRGSGRGHGRGGGAPAPAPAPAVSPPAPSAQPPGEIGRGEGSFQFVPQGSIIIPPVVQAQPAPGMPPVVQAAPCPECGSERIVTIPVQLHLRAATQIGAVQTQSIAPRGSCP